MLENMNKLQIKHSLQQRKELSDLLYLYIAYGDSSPARALDVPDTPSRLLRSMLSLGADFKERSSVTVTPWDWFAIQTFCNFRIACQELFRNGASWGKVIALFVMAEYMANRLFQEERVRLLMPLCELVAQCAEESGVLAWVDRRPKGWMDLIEYGDKKPSSLMKLFTSMCL